MTTHDPMLCELDHIRWVAARNELVKVQQELAALRASAGGIS